MTSRSVSFDHSCPLHDSVRQQDSNKAAAADSSSSSPARPPSLVVLNSSLLQLAVPRAQQAVQLHRLNQNTPHVPRIAFRIVTTAPKSYHVLPAFGIMEPSCNTMTVSVKLLDGHQADSRSHRFRLYATSIDDGDTRNRRQVWHNVPLDKHKMQMVVLRVVGADDAADSTTSTTTATHRARSRSSQRLRPQQQNNQ